MNDRGMKQLLEKEMATSFEGWDFSYLTDHGRMEEFPRPWNYQTLVTDLYGRADSLLDLGTGGGEFLARQTSLPEITCATESYEPNLKIASERLGKLGIEVRNINDNIIPWEDASFDLITNRHEDYLPSEIRRVLKPGGTYITQQVGGLNDSDLNTALGADLPDFADWCLAAAATDLITAGLNIIRQDECFTKTRFYDIGAVVYYLKCIPWQIEDFIIDRYFDRLRFLAGRIEAQGYVDFICHRFVIVAASSE